MKKFTFSRMLSAAALMVLSLAANAQYVKLTAIGGSKINQGEGVEYLVDGKVGTKWGQSFDPRNYPDGDRGQCYAILKAEKAIKPTSYFLVTGNDTKSYPKRNWDTWKIYGGNFANDKDAVKGAEGWEEIESQENVFLPEDNSKPKDFTMAEPSKAYTHFWIDVIDNGEHADIWTQMDEFGFGTYAQFQEWVEEQAQDVTKPIEYTIIAGDRNNGDGESLTKLFDGNYGTKWGDGITENKKGETKNGKYFIIKTSRSVSPDYIKLVTGTDNASWNHRNWRDFELYGIADVNEADIKRDSEGWVELAAWDHVTEDVLPDKNSYEVFLPFEKKNDNKYRYFKVEIHAIMSGGGYMQMSEFTLGDEHMEKIDKANMVKNATSSVDLTKKFQKSLLDELNAKLQEVENAADIAAAKEKANELDAIVAKIKSSINAYETYIAILSDVRNHYENHTCIVLPAGKEIIGKYLNDNVNPDATFTNGSSVYVLENCLLNEEEITAEGKYANSLLEAYATDLLDGAIDTENLEWTALSASKLEGGEGAAALFDHAYTSEDGTKWGFSGAGWGVFKCETGQIDPTYYTLCVANDTDGSKGRQWKTWKIYGANFASDEEATRDAAGWVLIDEKIDVADADFPTTNFSQTTFSMTNGGGAYQYFRIEVIKNRDGNTSIGSGNYTQMGELLFYNQANFRVDRNEKYIEMADFDLDEIVDEDGNTYQYYEKALRTKYEETLEKVSLSADGKELNGYVSTLKTLQGQILSSAMAYQEYIDQYDVMSESSFTGFENGSTTKWAEAYFGSEAIAPNALLRYGSHEYILGECLLTATQISEEAEYLMNMDRVCEMGADAMGLVYLSGYVVNQWGDGHPKHLVDGITGTKEENNPPSKLGGNIDASGKTHVIFKTLEQVNPFFYTLMTGGDTYTYQDRNWGAWDIYGANFEGDGEATEDSEGWILIDSKNGVTKERLLPDNLTKSPFGFMVNGVETTTPYQYYKIVVNSCFQNGKTEFVGGATQMQELTFGTEEEFDEIKEEWSEAAKEYPYASKMAYDELRKKYASLIEDSIGGCVNMEVLYRIRHQLDVTQAEIEASEKVYTAFSDKVNETRDLIAQCGDETAPGYEMLNNYVNEDLEPCAEFENGSATYIIENNLIPDSIVAVDETDRLKALTAAYVADAYIAGTEITSLFKNSSFEAFEGWEGDSLYTNGKSVSGKTTAAEWCVTNGGKFNAYQTLTGMKPGYYKVDLAAAFRANRDKYCMNSAALVYANDAQMLIPTLREYMADEEDSYLEGTADKPIYEGDKDPEGEETPAILGYVIWGTKGSASAFEKGRYRNVVVAKVGEDGVLTVGLKNIGTPKCTESGQDDWTCAGDLHVTYLGTDEAKVAAAIEEMKAVTAERAQVLAEDYAYYIEDAGSVDAVKKSPAYAAEVDQMLASAAALSGDAAIATISEAFARIPEEKLAYANAYEGMTQITDKWYMHDPDVEDEDLLYDLLMTRQYDAAGADAALAAMYAKYPEYFGIKYKDNEDVLLINNLEADETAPFCYEIELQGKSAYADFDGLYKAADSTRVYLLMEYTAAQDLDVTLYYSYPTLGGVDDAIKLAATTASKKIAIHVNPARMSDEVKWCFAKDHGFRLSFAQTEGSLTLSNILLVSEDEIEGAEVITGINNVEDAIAPVNGGIYNIAGQRVSKAQKGIYIINGNKVLVK